VNNSLGIVIAAPAAWAVATGNNSVWLELTFLGPLSRFLRKAFFILELLRRRSGASPLLISTVSTVSLLPLSGNVCACMF
jgi:hypothetical protein